MSGVESGAGGELEVKEENDEERAHQGKESYSAKQLEMMCLKPDVLNLGMAIHLNFPPQNNQLLNYQQVISWFATKLVKTLFSLYLGKTSLKKLFTFRHCPN